MDDQLRQIELVRRAQRGDRQALEHLARQARERLRLYVYRLTLQEDLAQEIVQESLLEMVKVLGKLQKPDRFWPWLYGIAVNKLRHHYRSEKVHRKAAAARAQRDSSAQQRQEGAERLLTEELKQIVAGAMKKLRTRHRAVLVMRCYDDMSYAEIAESMGSSEFGTRMLFMRAKRALQKELSRNGFGKGSLLAALLVFGKMTAPSEAAAAQVSVSAATMKVGVLAGLAGLATTKTAIVSLTAAGALTAGTLVTTMEPGRDGGAVPGVPRDAGAHVAGTLAANGGGPDTFRYYFPQGPDEPVMMVAASGQAGQNHYWQVLQDDYANYFTNGRTVTIRNCRTWMRDLSVMRLPTDSAELTRFLAQVDPIEDPIEYVRAQGRGLLVVAERDADPHGNRSWAMRHNNVLEEDYFRHDPPAGSVIVDSRDAMHKRGRTYFEITGQINGRPITGAGRLPFVWDAAQSHKPWLHLQVQGGPTIIDRSEGARVVAADGRVAGTHAAGSFFRGLSRPWTGLHTIDVIRRDAARKRVRFSTGVDWTTGVAKIEMAVPEGRLIYRVLMDADLVDEISFSSVQKQVGRLTISYLLDLDDADARFTPPALPSGSGAASEGPGLLWLARLFVGSLGD